MNKLYTEEEVTAMHHELWNSSRDFSQMLDVAVEALERIEDTAKHMDYNCDASFVLTQAQQTLKQIKGDE